MKTVKLKARLVPRLSLAEVWRFSIVAFAKSWNDSALVLIPRFLIHARPATWQHGALHFGPALNPSRKAGRLRDKCILRAFSSLA